MFPDELYDAVDQAREYAEQKLGDVYVAQHLMEDLESLMKRIDEAAEAEGQRLENDPHRQEIVSFNGTHRSSDGQLTNDLQIDTRTNAAIILAIDQFRSKVDALDISQN